MTTYHIHINSRSNFASTTEQCAVVSSGGFPTSVEIVAHQIDEIQIYIAPRLMGSGRQPFRYPQLPRIVDGQSVEILETKQLDGDLFVRGLINRQLFQDLRK